MLDDEKRFSFGRNWVAFALLSLLVFLIYSNTFHASWHFDDYPNIIENPHLHITNLQPNSIIQSFYFSYDRVLNQSTRTYRPISCLTLALNWYLGKDNVVGYHIVNTIIHFFTAFILFMTISSLFKTPNLKGKYQGSEYFIALLAASLWATTPIQTQAVTYIVQRMAAMVAMFYVLAIYFYVKGRLSRSRLNQVFLYVGCLLCFVLGLGSKENAATLPAALLLAEIAFFQDIGLPRVRKKFFQAAAGIGVFVILVGTLLFMKGDMLSFINYEYRPFSLSERLLTEPRVLIIYLTQLFYPVVSHFSIEHDIMVSTSLFRPWTTLPAILLVFFLIGIGFSQIRKRPIVAFSILFFFLNHVIESTILPLEIVFEHRNYLPSLFLFFPVSLGIKWLLDYYRAKQRLIYLLLVSLVTILVMATGIGTYTRNMAWATEKSLWEDAMAKAPKSPRPPHNLAYNYYEKIGRFDKAYELYGKASHLKSSNVINHRALSLTNMALILAKKHEYEKAILLFKMALEIDPQSEISLYNMILALIKTGRLGEASEQADMLLSKRYNHIYYLLVKGFILVRQNRPEEALTYFESAIELDPNYQKALLYKGIVLSFMGKHKPADTWLRRAIQMGPNNIGTLFCAIENSVKAGDIQMTDMYLERLFALFAIKDISSALRDISADRLAPPISKKLLAPVIAERLEEKAKEIKEFSNVW
jgi:tetratricopeptide (TPR) repeat protein